MTLRLDDLTLRDFRSYETFSLHGIGMLTILVGPNAVGKTNIIEGIQLLTALTSFRHATIEQLVRQGAHEAFLSCRLHDEVRDLSLSLTMENHAKHYTLNGKKKRPQDVRGLAPSVCFTPDDLDLLKGPMSKRRHALDVLGSQISQNYHQLTRDFEKVLQHKNRLLKDEAPDGLLDSIDDMFILCGAQLSCYRAALVARMQQPLQDRYETISRGAESLSLHYVPSWAINANDADDENEPFVSEAVDESTTSEVAVSFTNEEARACLGKALRERRAEERARKRSVVGPQADGVRFTLDGNDASLFASQGQQRSVVLAEKLTESRVIEEVCGQKPILLLDDVMSELDDSRRKSLVEYLSGDVQTFISTAHLDYFDETMLHRADIVELPRNGS